MNFTSRSAVEAFQDCPRYRWNQYFLGDKGVVPVTRSIPLATGSAIHRGVEHCLNRIRVGQEVDSDNAAMLAVETYIKECENRGFRGKDLEKDAQQRFTFNEQKALVEALVRIWIIRELPLIKARYKILAVEREIEPIKLVDDIWFQAKVDAEFQELETGDYHNYSLKTMRQWGEREENSYKSDLQGLTEIWAVEEDAKRNNTLIQEVDDRLEFLKASNQYPPKNLFTISDWLKKQKLDKKIMGVRFCFLIKGAWKKNEYSELKVTYNPFIRGYKFFSPNGISYAHSWYYPNPENKSGKSILGKGWEPFNVWESDLTIKQWVEAIASGQIQEVCGDLVSQYVVTPPEYCRHESEIEEGIREVREQEVRVFQGGSLLNSKNIRFGESREEIEARYFPHNRKHCFFHFGDQCEYFSLCWSPEVNSDPIGSGLYEIRTPHHEKERLANM